MTDSAPTILSIRNLVLGFGGQAHQNPVLRGVTFDLHRGEILALVGESGCGKTLTALTVVNLLPPAAWIDSGEVLLNGTGDLLSMPEKSLRRVRGARVAMIFQDPGAALNPIMTLGAQLREILLLHRGLRGAVANQEAQRLLELVALPEAQRRLRSYPHELSGGQRQRVILAMAVACQPQVLLADEPTTALDVTVQAQILRLLDELRRELDLSILLITHDLGVVATLADRVAVMYAGQIVEQAPVARLFAAPSHPYSRALLQAVPRLGRFETEGRVRGIPGRVPAAAELPLGCSFAPRCRIAVAECSVAEPPWIVVGESHQSRCALAAPIVGRRP